MASIKSIGVIMRAISALFLLFFLSIALWATSRANAAPTTRPAQAKTVRVAAAQPRARLVDWHIKNKDEILGRVDKSLRELEGLMDQAAKQHCDIVVLPEDTLGLGNW